MRAPNLGLLALVVAAGGLLTGVFLGGVTIVPAGLVMHRTRKLLKSGYGQEEVAAATHDDRGSEE